MNFKHLVVLATAVSAVATVNAAEGLRYSASVGAGYTEVQTAPFAVETKDATTNNNAAQLVTSPRFVTPVFNLDVSYRFYKGEHFAFGLGVDTDVVFGKTTYDWKSNPVELTGQNASPDGQSFNTATLAYKVEQRFVNVSIVPEFTAYYHSLSENFRPYVFFGAGWAYHKEGENTYTLDVANSTTTLTESDGSPTPYGNQAEPVVNGNDQPNPASIGLAEVKFKDSQRGVTVKAGLGFEVAKYFVVEGVYAQTSYRYEEKGQKQTIAGTTPSNHSFTKHYGVRVGFKF